MGYGSRLKDAMTVSGMSVAVLARKRHVSTKTVRDWLAMGLGDLKARHACGCALDLNVSVIWLSLGLGSPEPQVSNRKAAREAELAAHL